MQTFYIVFQAEETDFIDVRPGPLGGNLTLSARARIRYLDMIEILLQQIM